MADPGIPREERVTALEEYEVTVDERDDSWTMYTGLLILLAGVFAIFEGLITLANDGYQTYVSQGAFVFGGAGWGWINLLLGLLLVGAALGLLTGQEWSRMAGVAVVGTMAIIQMIYLTVAPTRVLIMVGICALALYGLVVRART
jgi:hypothetical protein